MEHFPFASGQPYEDEKKRTLQDALDDFAKNIDAKKATQAHERAHRTAAQTEGKNSADEQYGEADR